jgi:hypothetical protein
VEEHLPGGKPAPAPSAEEPLDLLFRQGLEKPSHGSVLDLRTSLSVTNATLDVSRTRSMCGLRPPMLSTAAETHSAITRRGETKVEPVYGRKRIPAVPGERKTWIDRYTDSEPHDSGREFIDSMLKRNASVEG